MRQQERPIAWVGFGEPVESIIGRSQLGSERIKAGPPKNQESPKLWSR